MKIKYKKRIKLNKRQSKKKFLRGVVNVHPKNDAKPMRGGIRL